jgi:valyl-tRNA synthetase
MAAQGRDVKLDPSRVAGYRNFGTKLWNATRFAEMNGVARDPRFVPADARLTVNRWVLTELSRATAEMTAAIVSYRFNDAASAAYRFVWNNVCDWYLELLKPVFMGEDEVAKTEARACTAYVLEETYKLLHPIMPFMTEELWAHSAGEGQTRKTLLCHAPWPEHDFQDAVAAAEINWLVDLVTDIRSARASMNVPPAAMAPLVMVGANTVTAQRLERHGSAIKRLARISEITLSNDVPKGALQLVSGEATACLPLGGLVDVAAERARLEKARGKAEAEHAKIAGKLGNEKFVANAKPEVVEAERERLAEAETELRGIDTALARLNAMA